MPDILGWILDFDNSLSYFFHVDCYNSVLSGFFHLITNSSNWKIPLVLIWLFLLIKGGKTGRTVALLLLPLFLLSDFTTAKILKPIFGRSRPFGHGGFAFPSVHATNAWAVTTLFRIYYPHKAFRIFLIVLATLIAFSRVYIGVHYPLDIIAGSILGILYAHLIHSTWLRSKQFWQKDFEILYDERTKP